MQAMFFVNDVVMQSKDDDTFTELRQLVLMEHGYFFLFITLELRVE